MLSAREREARRLTNAAEWSRLADLCADDDEALKSPALAYARAEALYHTGRMRELASYAERYAVSARTEGDVLGEMRALNVGGIAAFELGEVARASQAFDRLMGLAEGERHHDMLARAANNLGAIANLRGHHHEALGYYRLAVLLYQRLGQKRGLAQTHHNIGVSHRDLGDFEAAADALDRSADIGREIEYPTVVGMSLTSRAETELARGDHDLAETLATKALELATAAEDPISRGDALRVRGCALIGLDRRAEGRADLETALEIARETGNTLLQAEVLRDNALNAGETDDPERLVMLQEALALFRSLGAVASAEALTTVLEEADA